MFYSIRGKLILKDRSFAVIEAGGVGYACNLSAVTLSSLGAAGCEETLFTYLFVREGDISLYGFYTLDELNCFKMLISVSGVGPKAALAILSVTNSRDFILAVASGDTKAFTKVKGIGAKIAQRIVIELKDKVLKEKMSEVGMDDFAVPLAASESVSEAVSALVSLGYSQSEAVTVIAGLPPEFTAGEMIKHSLKKLAVR
ncbi:MAG: Holliday junction branch migration protein RuvA [Oscillospiraceae bacterium]|jgi:Holliday junction DNA helicase RuvA|nr:Holliday junction branch migration protein RuvA [Oscillospiraceae bacterium]